MRKIALHILIFVVIPISFGGFIYFLTRPDSLIMFAWLDTIGLSENILKLRTQIDMKSILSNLIVYNLPAWIWSFSFTALLGILWNYNMTRKNIFIFLIPTILGVLQEIFQFIELISGTFDYYDLLLYILGGLSGILVIFLIKVKHKFNLS